MSRAMLGPCKPKANDSRLAARHSEVPAAACGVGLRAMSLESMMPYSLTEMPMKTPGLRAAQRRRRQAGVLQGFPGQFQQAYAAADRSAPPRGRRCRRNGCRTRRSAPESRPSGCTSCRAPPDRDRRSASTSQRSGGISRMASHAVAKQPPVGRRDRCAARKTAGHAHDRDRLGVLLLERLEPRLRLLERKTARCSGVMFFRRSAS